VKVAVAGPTGVLGRALIPQLLAAGHSVRCLARDVENANRLWRTMPVVRQTFPEARLESVQCDLLESGAESRLVSQLEGCDAVIHAATAIPGDPAAPGAWDRNTQLRTRGTGRLQRAALEAGVKCFLAQSVVMAYRDGGEDWLDESAPLDKSAERAHLCQPVAIVESMMRLFRHHHTAMRWAVLRGGHFVGPGTAQERQIQALKRGEKTIAGDGKNWISPVNVEDAAAAYVLALERAPAGSTFNICDEPIRYRDYLERLADLIGAPRPGLDPSRPRHPSYRCSHQKASQILGWKPVHGIWPWPVGDVPASRD